MLVHYPFFNILKLALRKAVLGNIYTRDISTSMHICDDVITSILCSKTVGCIIILRPFDLGHFERCQLAYPHCSWASLLGRLLVLSAHSFASNWQLPFLNQRKGQNGRIIFSWPNLHERMCRAWGSNPQPSACQDVRTCDRVSAPGLKDI